MKRKLASDGTLVWEFDDKKKFYKYHVRKESDQSKLWKIIEFNGFDKFPQGVYKEGYGFQRNGRHLVEELKRRLKSNIKFTISVNAHSKLKKLKRGYALTLKYSDFQAFLKEYSRLNKIKNDKSKNFCLLTLYSLFPKSRIVKKDEFSRNDYTPDTFHTILNSRFFTLKNLSKADIATITKTIPSILDKFGKAKNSALTQTNVISIQNKSRRLFLERVIEDFERRLNKKAHKESDWQEFLKANILIVNSSYTDLIDRKNISLAGKFPDFMLIDTFDYLDIFEIKKPDTPLFKHDESRNNYYWSDECSKAISQVENYIAILNENALAIAKDIKREKKIDVKIIRPRGFIIAGHTKQLKNEKMKDDFRILRASLKNIDILTYDDLFFHLKHFMGRLK